MTILRATALTAVALALAACSTDSKMMNDGVESPTVSSTPQNPEPNTARTGPTPTYGVDSGAAYTGVDGGPVDAPTISSVPQDPEPYTARDPELVNINQGYNTGGPVDSTTVSSVPQDPEPNAIMVGGAPMYADRNVVQNASTANNLTTLVAAVQAAELVETLEGPGPFTIFAPVNSAFDALPAGTVDTLLQPQNKGQLQNVLTYHVVPGVYDTDAILAQKGDNLSTSLGTVSGGSLTINPAGDDIYVIDSKGNAGRVIQSNVYQSNGVVHVIDTVMLP